MNILDEPIGTDLVQFLLRFVHFTSFAVRVVECYVEVKIEAELELGKTGNTFLIEYLNEIFPDMISYHR